MIYIFALMQNLDAKPVIRLKPRHFAHKRPDGEMASTSVSSESAVATVSAAIGLLRRPGPRSASR
jgi:hypothetical protein